MKKIWHGILNFTAWLTQDSSRLRKAKRLKPEHEIELQRMRSRRWG